MPSARPFNRYFWSTLLGLVAAAEIVLRLVPYGDPRVFRTLYGNTLSMHMEVASRLRERAADVRILALGDSLTMTQFQPDAFAAASGLEAKAVFNAGYLGMSFPSELSMLQEIGSERLSALEVAIVFVNPRRLSADEEPISEIFRIVSSNLRDSLEEAWSSKKVAPLLDHSRLYGLSRYLVVSMWRELLLSPPSWDRLEYLQPTGGTKWMDGRANGHEPRYPFSRLQEISPARLGELEEVVSLLRGWGARVTLLVPPLHPAIDPFASHEMRTRFDQDLERLARRHGARYLPNVGSRFAPIDDRVFCDYGHMNWSGGVAYSQELAAHRARILQEGMH